MEGGGVVYDETMQDLGSPLVHANVAAISSDAATHKAQFAQLQRPRSPVPAAAAIHESRQGQQLRSGGGSFAEVTYVPVATAGPCRTDCQMVMPFMVLLFFMTLLVAVAQVNKK